MQDPTALTPEEFKKKYGYVPTQENSSNLELTPEQFVSRYGYVPFGVGADSMQSQPKPDDSPGATLRRMAAGPINLLANVPTGLQATFDLMGRPINNLIGQFDPELAAELERKDEAGRETAKRIRESAKRFTEETLGAKPGTPVTFENLSKQDALGKAYMLARGTAETIPSTLTLLGLRFLNAPISLATTFLSETGQTEANFQELEKEGVEIDPAYRGVAVVGAGALKAALEKFGLDNLAKISKVPGAKGKILKVFASSISEGGTEGVQELTDIVSETGAKISKQDAQKAIATFREELKKAIPRLEESTILGTLSGGTIGGGVEVAHDISSKRARSKTQQEILESIASKYGAKSFESLPQNTKEAIITELQQAQKKSTEQKEDNATREQVAQQAFGKKFDDLTSEQKQKIVDKAAEQKTAEEDARIDETLQGAAAPEAGLEEISQKIYGKSFGELKSAQRKTLEQRYKTLSEKAQAKKIDDAIAEKVGLKKPKVEKPARKEAQPPAVETSPSEATAAAPVAPKEPVTEPAQKKPEFVTTKAESSPSQSAVAPSPVSARAGEESQPSKAAVIDKPLSEIATDTDRFQNRATDFSEKTAATVAERFDPNLFDPIVLWKDPQNGKDYVLSGHSRLEGMKRRGAKNIPSRYFQGTEAEAMNFAKVEANRLGSAENLQETIKAYKQARRGNATKSKLKDLFDGDVDFLESAQNLNESGDFLRYLGQGAATEFPYIKRFSRWVGELRKTHGEKLTDRHEQQVFDWLYKGEKRNREIEKDRFFELVEKQVSRTDFDPNAPLQLKRGEAPRIGTRGRADTAKLEAELDQLRADKKNARTPAEAQAIDKEIARVESAIKTMVKTQPDLFATPTQPKTEPKQKPATHKEFDLAFETFQEVAAKQPRKPVAEQSAAIAEELRKQNVNPVIIDELTNPRRALKPRNPESERSATSRPERIARAVPPPAAIKQKVDAVAQANVDFRKKEAALLKAREEIKPDIEARGGEVVVDTDTGAMTITLKPGRAKISEADQALIERLRAEAAEAGAYSLATVGQGFEVSATLERIADAESLPAGDFKARALEFLRRNAEAKAAEKVFKQAKEDARNDLVDYYIAERVAGKETPSALLGRAKDGTKVEVMVRRVRSAAEPDLSVGGRDFPKEIAEAKRKAKERATETGEPFIEARKAGEKKVTQAKERGAFVAESQRGYSPTRTIDKTNNPIFYSQLLQVVSNKLPGSGTAEQMLQAIDAFQKKGDFKKEEVEWLGLREWLQGKSGKVTKQEIVDFVKEHQVEIVEKQLSYKKAKFKSYVLSGGNNYKELLLTFPEQDKNSFKSSHFEEKNILAHVRLNERIDASGERVLFIEEIQSDWHQQGRGEGYKKSPSATQIEIAKRLNDEANAIRTKIVDAETTEEKAQLLAELSKKAETLRELKKGFDFEGTSQGVPNAPFKTTWHELAFKRMLRYAVDKGFDKIAWTTGEQQAERYDLSKSVERIEYSLNNDGTANFEAIANDDGVSLIGKNNASKADVVNTFGKDIADRIFNDEGIEDESFGEGVKALVGDDLKVGGEGMKGFYDKIIPDFVRKYTKKWGGEISQTEIQTGKDEFETVHSLDMTDAMREAIPKGQVLFESPKPYEPNYKKRPDATPRTDRLAKEIVNDLGNNRKRGRVYLANAIDASARETGQISLIGQSIKTTDDLAVVGQVARDPRVEHLRYVLVKDGESIGSYVVGSRLPSATAAFPYASTKEGIAWLNEIMEETGADGYFMLHNHPSGEVDTSGKEDLDVTETVSNGVKGFKGHVIIDSNVYATITRGKDGSLKKQVKQKFFGEDKLLKPSIDNPLIGRKAENENDLMAIGKAVQTPEGWATVVGTTPDHRIRGIAEIEEAILQAKGKRRAAVIRKFARDTGSAEVFLVADQKFFDANKDTLKKAVEFGFIRDAVSSNGESILSQFPNLRKSNVFFGKEIEAGRVVKEGAQEIPDTITVNGKERPTRNSKGQLIHSTRKGIENFWKWFGDSKVVDEQGRPIAMYHGTRSSFDVFDLEKSNKAALYGTGFYFTESPDVAGSTGGATTEEEVYTKAAFNLAGYAFQGRSFELEPLTKKQLSHIKRLFSGREVEREAREDIGMRRNWANGFNALKAGEKEFSRWVANDAPMWFRERIKAERKQITSPQVYSVYLSAKNPFIMNKVLTQAQASETLAKLSKTFDDSVIAATQKTIDEDFTKGEQVTNNTIYQELSYQAGYGGDKSFLNKDIEDSGYDSIQHEGGNIIGTHGKHGVTIVFNPAQIKSAIGNRGTFSPDEPSIIRESESTYGKANLNRDQFLDLGKMVNDFLQNKEQVAKLSKAEREEFAEILEVLKDYKELSEKAELHPTEKVLLKYAIRDIESPEGKRVIEKVQAALRDNKPIEASWLDKIAEWTASMYLWRLASVGSSIGSNLFRQLLKYPELKLAAWFNQGVARQTRVERTRFSEEAEKDFRDAWTGEEFKKAARKAIDIMAEKPDAAEESKFFEREKIKRKAIKGIKGKIIRAGLNAQAAIDVLFRQPATTAAISRYAFREAAKTSKNRVEQAKKASAIAQNVRRLKTLKDAKQDVPEYLQKFEPILAKAEADAEAQTFQSELEGFLKHISEIRRYPLARIFVPFFNTRMNVLLQAYARTPLSAFGSEFRDLGAKALNKKLTAEEAGRLSDRMAEITLGTAAFLVTTAALYGLSDDDEELITGDFDEKTIGEKPAGWLPNAVRVGDTFVSLKGFEPYATIFTAFGNAASGKKSIPRNAAEALAKAAFSNPMTDELFDIMGSLKDGDADKFLVDMVSGAATPGLLQDISKIADPTVRQKEGLEDRFKSKVGIPGTSTGLLPRIDVFGEELAPQTSGERALKAVTGVSISKSKEDPARREIRKLGLKHSLDAITHKGVELEPWEVLYLNQSIGKQYHETVLKLLQNPTYLAADNEARKDKLRSVRRKLIDDQKKILERSPYFMARERTASAQKKARERVNEQLAE